MEVDSFAEYVSVRWSMLYRLAVLLAGPARADDVMEAALLRAYVAWRQVPEAVSADEAVKKILVNTAVAIGKKDGAREAPARGGPEERGVADDPAATEREVLWSRITALPPRERAVIVLLYFEDRSEGEVARTLGCSAGTVKALAFSALTTHLADYAAHDVRYELFQRADEVVVPPAPVDELMARGHRERRTRVRRSLTWSAAAAAVLVTGTALANVVDASDPTRHRPAAPASSSPPLAGSLARLPAGAPADVAYVSGRTLHVEGRRVALTGQPSAIAQTPSRVFLAYPTGRIEQVSTSTLAIETVTTSAAGPMVTDPGGNYVAWPVVRDGRGTVVLRSLGAGAAADAVQRFPAKPRCCDNPFLVAGMTHTGELVASMPSAHTAWVWDTRGGRSGVAVREIAGLGDRTVHHVTRREILVDDPPFRYVAGVLEDGVFRVTGSFRARTVDVADPQWHRLVFVDDDGETHVRERRPPRRGRGAPFGLQLGLPVLDAGFASAHWEDPDHVLLDVSDDVMPHGALVRCNVESGACEIAATFDGPHLVAR